MERIRACSLPGRWEMLWYVHLFSWRVSHIPKPLASFFDWTNPRIVCCQEHQAAFFFQDGCTNTFLCECWGWAFHSSYWWVCPGLTISKWRGGISVVSQDEPRWHGFFLEENGSGKSRQKPDSQKKVDGKDYGGYEFLFNEIAEICVQSDCLRSFFLTPPKDWVAFTN